MSEGATVQVEDTAIPAVKIVTPKKHGDARGFFSEVYNKAAFEAAGLHLNFVQDNHAFSAAVGTLRGLHFQTPPFAQDKLLRVARGRILDVAVDIRRSVADFRPTCRGRAVGGELAAVAGADRLRPRLRHARARHRSPLQDDRRLFAANERGVAWDDPDIGVAWPLPEGGAMLSEKDKRWPRLRDAQELFD